jgi:flagellar basal-body rod protein FlgF
MPGAAYIALSGMRTRLDQLDRLSADIANGSTAGYKLERTGHVEADRPQFEAVFQSAIDVTTGSRRLDTSGGAINQTGRELDLSVDGKGFFVVETPGGTRYTRNGHFTRRADGMLTTEEGNLVQGTTGPLKLGTMAKGPMKVGMGKIAVDEDGTIRAGGVEAGKLLMVEFDDPGLLAREGAATLRADGFLPHAAQGTTVQGGSLEQSNVSIVERFAELTEVRRTFEALQKAVSMQMNDIDAKAIDILGRR